MLLWKNNRLSDPPPSRVSRESEGNICRIPSSSNNRDAAVALMMNRSFDGAHDDRRRMHPDDWEDGRHSSDLTARDREANQGEEERQEDVVRVNGEETGIPFGSDLEANRG